MGASFNEQFDQHGAWRRGFAAQLQELREWLMAQELLDAGARQGLSFGPALVEDGVSHIAKQGTHP